MLQQLLEVWAVKNGKPYDVFEIPPMLSKAEHLDLEIALKKYSFIVSTFPWENAYFVGEGTLGKVVDLQSASEHQLRYEEELTRLGWLK
jgi:hypothetical protein